MVGAGVLSFALSFGASWIWKRNQPVLPKETPQAQGPNQETRDDFSSLPRALQAAETERSLPGLSERQLQGLIEDIRTRMQEYRSRETELEKEARRIELARQSLQEEIDRLNQLRNKIVMLTQNLDEKEQQYKQTLLNIKAIEAENFQHLAATYDKMDTTQAGRILANMATGPQAADAIKILYYMSERTAAKVLGEIGNSQPDLAALISIKLKRIQKNG